MASCGRNKRLEGVKASVELRKLLVKAVSLAENIRIKAKDDGEEGEEKKNLTKTMTNDMVRKALRPMSLSQAAAVLLKDFTNIWALNYIPIPVLRAMKVVFKVDADDSSFRQIEKALTLTSLVFTPLPPTLEEMLNDNGDEEDKENINSLTKEQKRFRQRMQRLRFKNEETKYAKLTRNLGSMTAVQDDVTTKSMTYAASIGLNMIVAPITFGVFMYFFAGSLLDFFWPPAAPTLLTNSAHNPVDIKKVIAGVVSGVVMLFIEMLLFVIRTHEMDKAMRRKQKKNKKSPFGYYSSSTNKTYQQEGSS